MESLISCQTQSQHHKQNLYLQTNQARAVVVIMDIVGFECELDCFGLLTTNESLQTPQSKI